MYKANEKKSQVHANYFFQLWLNKPISKTMYSTVHFYFCIVESFITVQNTKYRCIWFLFFLVFTKLSLLLSHFTWQLP